jgi:hypothetical protein
LITRLDILTRQDRYAVQSKNEERDMSDRDETAAASQDPQKVIPVEESRTSLMTVVMDKLVDYIHKADEVAAAERVQEIRQQQPEASTDDVIQELIRRKCIKAGSVGAVTSGAALIPGLGTLASLTFGVAADIGLTFKLQTELVLEIAAAHGKALSESEKQRVVLLVTGLSMGANQAVTRMGTRMSQVATERLARRSVAKAIPVIGVGASAGVNVVSTYLIGRRANAYFSLGEAEMGDWVESLRALTGVDERRIATWLGDAAWQSWNMIGEGVKGITSSIRSAGDTTGNFLVDAGRDLVGWSHRVGQRMWAGGDALGDYVLWWRRDAADEPPFLLEAGQSTGAADHPAEPIPEQVVAVIGASDQSAQEAGAQWQEAQLTVDDDGEGQRRRWDFLNPQNWFSREEATSNEPSEDDEACGLKIFSRLSSFKTRQAKSGNE